ncbi:MAG: hypothetical protein Q9163_006038 [Psora crenata]
MVMSPPTSPATSQASTVLGLEDPMSLDDLEPVRRRVNEPFKRTTTAQGILIFLLAFRLINALSIRTYFQPDEYFQSLEPAWQIAFGANSGAWITWAGGMSTSQRGPKLTAVTQEWKHHLRSAIHPAIFAVVYRIAAGLSWALNLPPDLHAQLLVATPKIVQAVCAALGDYYTWELGKRVYGERSNEAWAVVRRA